MTDMTRLDQVVPYWCLMSRRGFRHELPAMWSPSCPSKVGAGYRMSPSWVAAACWMAGVCLHVPTCLLKIVVYYSILLGYAYLILSYPFWIYLDGWLVPGLFVRPQIEDHIPPDVFSPPAFSGPIDDNATSCSRALAASKYDEEQ